MALPQGNTIDPLMSDVGMPGMSGRELAERLRASQPEIRVGSLSGHTDDAVVLRELDAPNG